MPKNPLPHDDIVHEIRKLAVRSDISPYTSDDMDMYYVEKAGFSPMLESYERAGRTRDRIDTLSERLVTLWGEAADAVAKGLRMQGRWGEHLLPFARKHRDVLVIEAALKLISQRRVDPLAKLAAVIISPLTRLRSGSSDLRHGSLPDRSISRVNR